MKQYTPGIICTVLFFVVGVWTQSHYGMHEDSPFHFLRGQYYLDRILGGDGEFDIPALRSPVLFFPGQRISSYKIGASEELFAPLLPITGFDSEKTIQQEYRDILEPVKKRSSFYKHNAWTANIWDLDNNQGHPAISDILMAASNKILYEFLGISGDIEAYFTYGFVVVAVSLLFLYLFVADAFGSFAANISVLSLALYPMVFAETHINIKDPVQMGYFTMALVSGYFTITRKLSLDWFVLFLGSIFLALGTKWNIVFLPIILVPWVFIVWKKTKIGTAYSTRRLLLYGVLACIIPFILLVILYPFYWTHTIYKILNTFEFYALLAIKDLRIQPATNAPLPGGFDGRAILNFLSMTPPIMLLFGVVGVVGVVMRKIPGKHTAGLLVFLWFIVPLLRVIWQTSEFFGSMRHFMEFLPAFAVLVGIGAAWVVRKRAYQAVFILIFLLVHVVLLVRWHPYEHIYFNRFFGGLSGAHERGMYTWETLFDAPYRQLATWLNNNAEKGARLAYLDGTMLALSPLWLRDDIHFGSYFSGLNAEGEYIASMIYPKPPSVFPINYLENFVRPVYELKMDGVVIAKIWKNDKEHANFGGNRRVFEANELKLQSNVTQGTDQVNIYAPSALRILSAIVEVSDVRCITVRNLVWGIVGNKQVTYVVPWISHISDTRALVAFPGIRGNGIQWWDREKAGCKSVNIIQLEGID